jgi:6-phosphogluconolactonase
MVRAALLDRVPAVGHRPEAERPDRAAAAAAYGAALPAALDAMVLGMGEDSHTASLFPGRAFDAPPGARVVAVAGAPKPPPERLTVTPAVIAAARALLVIVTGAGKAGPVARALEGPDRPDLYPVQLARRGTWLLDPAAASALSAPPKESPHG